MRTKKEIISELRNLEKRMARCEERIEKTKTEAKLYAKTNFNVDHIKAYIEEINRENEYLKYLETRITELDWVLNGDDE